MFTLSLLLLFTVAASVVGIAGVLVLDGADLPQPRFRLGLGAIALLTAALFVAPLLILQAFPSLVKF